MAKRFITITYEVWTPEDAEIGETDDRGWIDEEGESMEPDKWDREEGIGALDKTVEYLWDHGAYEGSEGGAKAASRWWTDPKHDEDFRTGAVEQRSYHLHGFSETEKREIQKRLEGKWR
jgi:hypothetical protein